MVGSSVHTRELYTNVKNYIHLSANTDSLRTNVSMKDNRKSRGGGC